MPIALRCPKGRCASTRLRPTGRVFLNRRKRIAAVMQCQACSYLWPSTLPAAIEACRALLEAAGQTMPTRAELESLPLPASTEPATPILPGVDLGSIVPSVRDFKADAAGDDE